jgi:hypothetical protein
MYKTEWQKRDLPHAHILIWPKQKIQSTDIEKVVYTELPDPQIDPLLFEIVKTNMIHGPCSNLNKSLCMSDGKCTVSSDLIRETEEEDGYTLRYLEIMDSK